MSGYIHCIRFRTPTGYVTSGHGAADSSFPHANAADLLHPHRPFKSSGAISVGNTFYGVDFGSAVQVAGVGIDNINTDVVTIEAASNSSFSSNVISQSIVVGPNAVERSLYTTSGGVSLGRYKAFINFDGTGFDAQARQYWRLIAGAASLDAVETKLVIGSVAWCRSLTTWSSGTSGYDELPLEATRVNDDFAGGGAEPVILGNPYAAVTLSASPGDLATMRTPLLALLREGIGRPFLFYRNDGDTADFYLCHRAGDVSVKTTAPTTLEFDQFILRSAV